MALLWAAGILYFAFQVAGSGDQAEKGAQTTDATGATITDEDAKKFQEAINSI